MSIDFIDGPNAGFKIEKSESARERQATHASGAEGGCSTSAKSRCSTCVQITSARWRAFLRLGPWTRLDKRYLFSLDHNAPIAFCVTTGCAAKTPRSKCWAKGFATSTTCGAAFTLGRKRSTVACPVLIDPHRVRRGPMSSHPTNFSRLRRRRSAASHRNRDPRRAGDRQRRWRSLHDRGRVQCFCRQRHARESTPRVQRDRAFDEGRRPASARRG